MSAEYAMNYRHVTAESLAEAGASTYAIATFLVVFPDGLTIDTRDPNPILAEQARRANLQIGGLATALDLPDRERWAYDRAVTRHVVQREHATRKAETEYSRAVAEAAQRRDAAVEAANRVCADAVFGTLWEILWDLGEEREESARSPDT